MTSPTPYPQKILKPHKSWISKAWPMARQFPEYPRDRRTVAFHEAGHAILCPLFNLPMSEAVVFDTELDRAPGGYVSLSEAHFQNPLNPATDKELKSDEFKVSALRMASMYMAGYQAEFLLHGVHVEGWLNLDVPDYRKARKALQITHGHDMGIYYCERYARWILNALWPAVESIAGVLEAMGKINYSQMMEIIKAEGDAIQSATRLA